MNIIGGIKTVLFNKYLLALCCFAVWMLIVDRNDLLTQLSRRRELATMEQSKTDFAKKIAEGKRFSIDMRNSAPALEKFVREKYLMKRDNEDLFLIQPPAAAR